MSRLDKDLAALPAMSSAQLQERWERTDGSTSPALPASILRPLLAQRLQERRHGGLPALVARELERIASGEPSPALRRKRQQLAPGARLVREWNGKTISVDVLEKGFFYDNRTWRSLSEIARYVTGAHWSGPRFFGL